jgi:hypothetical protein
MVRAQIGTNPCKVKNWVTVREKAGHRERRSPGSRTVTAPLRRMLIR